MQNEEIYFENEHFFDDIKEEKKYVLMMMI